MSEYFIARVLGSYYEAFVFEKDTPQMVKGYNVALFDGKITQRTRLQSVAKEKIIARGITNPREAAERAEAATKFAHDWHDRMIFPKHKEVSGLIATGREKADGVAKGESHDVAF